MHWSQGWPASPRQMSLVMADSAASAARGASPAQILWWTSERAPCLTLQANIQYWSTSLNKLEPSVIVSRILQRVMLSSFGTLHWRNPASTKALHALTSLKCIQVGPMQMLS